MKVITSLIILVLILKKNLKAYKSSLENQQEQLVY